MKIAAPLSIGRSGRRSSLDLYADAVRTLGPRHPVARSQHSITVAGRHAATACALLAAAPFIGLISRDLAVATGVAAMLVTTISCGVVAALSSRRRTQVHELVLERRSSAAELVRHEVGRLLDPSHRAEVARRLGRALHEAEHWDEYLPASRPPEAVLHLRTNAQAVHAIVEAIHGDEVSPRAVILLERFVKGGYGAAVYQGGGPDLVRRELGRIRFELGADAGRRPGCGA
jgi:hypothetical protein